MSSELGYKQIKVPNELITDIREYIGDNTRLNRIVEGLEFSDNQVRMACRLWLVKFNTSEPILTSKYYDLSKLDFPVWDLLFEGIIIELLTMGGIIQTRNYLQYQDSNISKAYSDKGSQYMGIVQTFVSNHQAMVRERKAALNAEEVYDFMPSPDSVGLFWDDDII